MRVLRGIGLVVLIPLATVATVNSSNQSPASALRPVIPALAGARIPVELPSWIASAPGFPHLTPQAIMFSHHHAYEVSLNYGHDCTQCSVLVIDGDRSPVTVDAWTRPVRLHGRFHVLSITDSDGNCV